MLNAWVVTRDYYFGEEIRRQIESVLNGAEVTTIYRDYNFRAMVGGEHPDLIIADGTCKTRDDHGYSVGIYYAFPKQFARQHRIPVFSPTFFGFRLMPILQFKLWWWGWRHPA